ncbi:MAG TPA: GAF domain-containing protein [Erysipelotrichaceae bacterium]|nr:GAF domain-containing protein [Erysipelotrichaceae bacterium]
MTLDEKLQFFIAEEKYLISLLANTSAFFNDNLKDVNWVGYYLFQDNQLILGPFQGKAACEIIPLNKGVCGHCAATRQTALVKDVHLFDGHIACDSASESELVIPIIIDGQLFGVLDIDSPVKSRFTEEDKIILEKCVTVLQDRIKQFL